jgi:hypothetical protein
VSRPPKDSTRAASPSRQAVHPGVLYEYSPQLQHLNPNNIQQMTVLFTQRPAFDFFCSSVEVSIFRAGPKKFLLFQAEKILPMAIPLDMSGLNFRAGLGLGAGRARAGLKMLRYILSMCGVDVFL